MGPSVLIIIANWNGQDVLRDCLTSLEEKTEYANYSVLVVDNGSDDGSVTMLESEFPQIDVVKNNHNRGFAKANNQGFEIGDERGVDYFMMLNNDIEVIERGWLTRLLDIAEGHPDVGVLGCRVVEPDGEYHYDGRNYPMSESIFPRLKSRYDYNRFEKENDDPEIRFTDDVVGALFLIRRSAFHDVGYLDEFYSPAYFEESDYCVRVWDAGWKVAYTPTIEVLHLRHQTSDKIDTLTLEYIRQRNQLYFLLLNYPATWILYGTPLLLAQVALFFVNLRGDGLEVRTKTPRDALRGLLLAFKCRTDLVPKLPQIIDTRRSRDNIKTLTK